MKEFFKKRIGLIILLVMIFAFPTSLSTQARLNMRAIVTGLAIDKVDGEYEVTAQIVKTSPSTESGGEKATVNFVSDTDKSIIGAISKLSYKTGKTAVFSHTNFIILGKEVAESNITETLDYFMRDNITNDSMLLLIAEDKASDEMKKTKDVELSIAIGLQKVFMYREKEGDGVMVSLLEFMRDSKSLSKTTLASIISLQTNEENGKDNPLGSGNESSSSSSSSGESSGSSGSSGGSESSGDSGTEDGGEQGGGAKYEYFEAQTAIGCFVDGKMVGKLEDDEVLGFMLSNKKSTIEDIYVNVEQGDLAGSLIGVKIKDKKNKYNVRFENNIPCLDINVKINNSSIYEIQSEKNVGVISEENFEIIKKALQEKISKTISKSFEKSKSIKADIWNSYDFAYKHHYKTTTKYYDNMQEFLENLRLNVKVEVDRLEY